MAGCSAKRPETIIGALIATQAATAAASPGLCCLYSPAGFPAALDSPVTPNPAVLQPSLSGMAGPERPGSAMHPWLQHNPAIISLEDKMSWDVCLP